MFRERLGKMAQPFVSPPAGRCLETANCSLRYLVKLLLSLRRLCKNVSELVVVVSFF